MGPRRRPRQWLGPGLWAPGLWGQHARTGTETSTGHSGGDRDGRGPTNYEYVDGDAEVGRVVVPCRDVDVDGVAICLARLFKRRVDGVPVRVILGARPAVDKMAGLHASGRATQTQR